MVMRRGGGALQGKQIQKGDYAEGGEGKREIPLKGRTDWGGGSMKINLREGGKMEGKKVSVGPDKTFLLLLSGNADGEKKEGEAKVRKVP